MQMKLNGNCHELRMHLSKFVCGNFIGFLATFHSQNLLFCLELSLSPPKVRHMRVVLPYIDAALNKQRLASQHEQCCVGQYEQCCQQCCSAMITMLL